MSEDEVDEVVSAEKNGAENVEKGLCDVGEHIDEALTALEQAGRALHLI